MPPLRVRGYLAALPSVIRDRAEAFAYRVYVTDAIKAIAENTAHFVVPGYGAVDYGSTLGKRWMDIMNPAPAPVEDNRPAVEIVADIWARSRVGKKGGE